MTHRKGTGTGSEKGETGRIWTYVGMIAMWVRHLLQRSGSRTRRTGRGKHPSNTSAPSGGILQADAFTGYDRLFSAEREGGALTEVACWAHARRKIHDVYISSKSATAEEALKRISELYAIEDEYGDYRSQSVLPSGSSESKCY